MIYPMMLKIDFAGLKGVAQRPKGLLVTLFVNWLVKPFSMALLRMDVSEVAFRRLGSRPEDGAQLHRRTDHPRRGAMHRDGVRLELPHRRRSGLHPGAGGRERSDHALRLCANRDVPLWRRRRNGIPATVLITSVVVFIVIPLVAGGSVTSCS